MSRYAYPSIALIFAALLTSPTQAEPVQPVKENDPTILNRYIDMLNAAHLCNWREDYKTRGNHRLKFNEFVQVLEFSCSVSPYNDAHLYVHLDSRDPDEAALLDFERPPSEPNDDPEVVFNGVWDIETGDLTSFMKGRGLGDCGTFEVHRFTPQGYPYLLEFRAKTECDGSYDQPENYPVILDRSE